jgi:hypothetical protein
MASVEKFAKTGPLANEISLKHFVGLSSVPFGPKKGERSVKRAIWETKLGRIKAFFDEDTPQEQEDKALTLFLSSESAKELQFLIDGVGWGAIDDELDEPAVDKVILLLSQLLDQQNYAVNRFLGRFIKSPEAAAEIPSTDIANAITSRLTAMSPDEWDALADELLAKRDAILNGVAEMALRRLSPNAREFRVLLDSLAAQGAQRANELTSLSWEVHYTNEICFELERGEFDRLLRTMPDMVDPALPNAQRVALFDMLRRWDAHFRAIEGAVNVVGSGHQRSDMRQFITARQVFLDNFSQTTPAPGVIATIAQALGGAATQIDQLRDDVADFASGTTDAISQLPNSLFNDLTDDEARNVATELHSQDLVWAIPFGMKHELIMRLLDGATVDDDEQATNDILRETSERSTAEFLQLITAATYEKLDSSLDGTEHDEFMSLLPGP